MSKRKNTEGCNRRKRDGVISGMTFDPENGVKQSRSVELFNSHEEKGEKKGKVGELSNSPEEKGEKKGKLPDKDLPLVATRTSARVLNRQTLKRDGSPPLSPPPCSKKQAKVPTKVTTPETTKSRRTWESWSSEDKDTFFEGLYQFGKDFEAIQHLIAQKCKKRGVLASVMKNREQVRHLYYRTWHKISKYIQQRPDVSKTTNELFGLINYGEFRRKVIGVLDDKTGPKLNELVGSKLNELVRTGNTSFKIKGKIKNIKTPMCRALKNLGNNEGVIVETTENEIRKPRLPEHVTIELKPRNNAAWTKVQTMAQNPCVRMKLRPEKHLSSVITFLNKKWKPHRVRTKAQLKAPEELPDKEICLSLPSNTELLPISIEQSVYTKPRGELVTLNNVATDAKVGPDGDVGGMDQTEKEKKSTAEDEPQTQSEDSCHSSDEIHDHSAEKSQDHVPIETDDNQNEFVFKGSFSGERGAFSSIFENELIDEMDVCTTGNQLLRMESLEEPRTVEQPKNQKETQDDKKEHNQGSPSAFESLRKGWTIKESNKATIAELWLAVGNPDKIVMNFEWVDCSNKPDYMQQSLANMLRRLIHLATTEFTDFSRQSILPTSPIKCAKCGCDNSSQDNRGTPPNNKKTNRAACGKSPKTSVSFKSQATQTVNIFSGRSRAPVGKVLNNKFDQNVHPEQLVNQDGMLNVRGTSDTVFRMPAIPIKTHTIRKDGVVNGIPKPVPSIVMPKKPRRSVQNRRPMVMQRTLLPKAQHLLPRQIVSMPVMPGDSQAVRNSALVLPPGVSGANQISIIGGKMTTVGPPKAVSTTTMSPAGTGVVAVKHLVPNISPPPPALDNQPVVKGTEGELLSMKVMQSDILPTDDVRKLFAADPTSVLNADMSPSKILQAAVSQAGISESVNDPVVSDVTGGTVDNPPLSSGFKPNLTSSPPNSLFDISLTGLEGVVENPEGNPEMEIAFDGNSVSSFSAFFDQADQRLDDEAMENKDVPLALPTPDILEDISLSSLIATEVPKKEKSSSCRVGTFNFTDNSLTGQMDLHSLMNDSSLDYVSKFAELVDNIETLPETQKEAL